MWLFLTLLEIVWRKQTNYSFQWCGYLDSLASNSIIPFILQPTRITSHSINLRVRLIILKCCCENFFIRNLMLGEKEWKYVAQQISPAHRTINFSQLLKRNLLSETYSFSGSTGIYLIEFNNNNNKVQNKFKVNNRTTRQNSAVFLVNFKYIWHVVLVFFLLTLNM